MYEIGFVFIILLQYLHLESKTGRLFVFSSFFILCSTKLIFGYSKCSSVYLTQCTAASLEYMNNNNIQIFQSSIELNFYLLLCCYYNSFSSFSFCSFLAFLVSCYNLMRKIDYIIIENYVSLYYRIGSYLRLSLMYINIQIYTEHFLFLFFYFNNFNVLCLQTLVEWLNMKFGTKNKKNKQQIYLFFC